MKQPPLHLRRGHAGELLARRWLEARGLVHVHSNFRCKSGELDLVMRERECLVFVEVRYRRHATHGGAMGSVTRAKQLKLMRSAAHFLQRHSDCAAMPVRFDVLALSGTVARPAIHWCKHAFYCD